MKIYKDIEEFLEAFQIYRNFITKGISKYPEAYTLEEIKRNVVILHANKKGRIGDPFVEAWYKEEHEQPKDFFKGKVVVYANENFLPVETEDFFFCRGLYTDEYEYFDGCTHMG